MITNNQFCKIDITNTKQPQHLFQSRIKATNTSQSFCGNFHINFVQFGAILHVIFAYFNDSNCVFVDIPSRNVVYLRKPKDWMQLLIMLLECNGHLQPNNTMPHHFSLTINIGIEHSITETRIKSKNKQYLMAYYCAKIRNNDRKTSFIMDIIVDCNMYHISENQSQTANKSIVNHRILVPTTTEMNNNITCLIIQAILSVTGTMNTKTR